MTWLVQEPEDTALVDGGNGVIEVGLTGEEDPDCVGELLASLCEELGAAFSGHPHVGNHYLELFALPLKASASAPLSAVETS